jgi:glutathione S-transferase
MIFKDLRIKHKLFYSPGASSLAPHIVLEEIGRPYELELVSAAGGRDMRSADSQAVNPKGRVPALTGVAGQIGSGEQVLTEAPAILVFLARSNPATGLLPADPAREARCLEWLSWLSGTVHAVSFGQLWRPARFSADEAHHAAIRAKGKESILQQYAYIESLLSDGSTWAVSGGYSVVDPYLMVFYYWGLRLGLDMKTRYPAWARLTAKTLERPAVQQAVGQEGLQFD